MAAKRALRESAASLHDRDFYTWTMEQAAALRRARARPIDAALDLDNLAEEIESLGKEQAHALRSGYRVLLIHLLKWAYQPARRSRNWHATIVRERVNIEDRLMENPGLRSRRDELYAHAYKGARRQVAAQTGLSIKTFPDTCPFSIDDACHDDFLPE